MPVKILLTGGTGFFGKALLKHLLIQPLPTGSSIDVLSRNPASFQKANPYLTSIPNLKFIQGDITNPSSLPFSSQYSHILHCATESTAGLSLSPLERYTHSVHGTENILKLAVRVGTTNLLFTSSGGIYGQQSPRVLAFNEEMNVSPDILNIDAAYSHAKRSCEHLCCLYSSQFGFNLTIARCFSFVGIDLPFNAHFAIGNFIYDALYKKEIVIKGSGTPIRSYLDQRDLADWLWKLLFINTKMQVFNVGSSIPYSLKQVAEIVRDAISPEKPIRVMGSSNLTASINRYVPDVTKASQIGLMQSISLTDSLLYIKDNIN